MQRARTKLKMRATQIQRPLPRQRLWQRMAVLAAVATTRMAAVAAAVATTRMTVLAAVATTRMVVLAAVANSRKA